MSRGAMMAEKRPMTVLCLASYEKGADFIRACKAEGCRVLLITLEKLADAAWPHEAIDDVYYMRDMYNRDDMIKGVSHLARSEQIDRIVALDDFDVEMAATLREHLRISGIGETTARYFRDKLAMRFKAQEEGLLVPGFVPVLNYDRIREFMERVPAPWVLKPRSEASALGIRKIHDSETLWRTLDELGDRQSFFLLERYIPGDVYHVDSITWEGKVLFAEVHQYAKPPLDVMHGGGIFASRTVARSSAEEQTLRDLNQQLISALGLGRGVTHTEFIRSNDDGQFYFLETGARVGGANIVEMVEAATGLNLWKEWARLETSTKAHPYQLPETRSDYAGILISLARQEHPDTSAYQDPEIVWRLDKRHHAGLIVASPDRERVEELLEQYMRRFAEDFQAVLPPPDKPTS